MFVKFVFLLPRYIFFSHRDGSNEIAKKIYFEILCNGVLSHCDVFCLFFNKLDRSVCKSFH